MPVKQSFTSFLLTIKISTLIVHGQNDVKFQPAVELLKQIPTSEVLTINNASHACYVEQPLIFHNGLRQFLYSVYRPIFIQQYKQRTVSSIPTSSPASSSVKVDQSSPLESRKEELANNETTKSKQ